MTSTAIHTLVSDGYDHHEDLLDFHIECPSVDGSCPDDDERGPCDIQETLEDLFIDADSPFAEPGNHHFRVQYTQDQFGEHDAHIVHLDPAAPTEKV